MGYTYIMKKIIITSLLITLLMPSISAQAATKSLKIKGNKAFCKNIKTEKKIKKVKKSSLEYFRIFLIIS